MGKMRHAARQWARQHGRRLAMVLTEWSDGNDWHPPERASIEFNTVLVRRRKPRRFEDLDKFDAFFDAVSAATPAGYAILDTPIRVPGLDPSDVKSAMATAALGSHARLNHLSFSGVFVEGADGDGGGGREVPMWSIQMSNVTGYGGAAIRVYGPTMGVDTSPYDQIPRLLDEHTVPLTRRERRSGVPLIRPLRAMDALQAEREMELTTKAARVAGWWGVLAGVAGGAGGAVIVQVLGG